MERLLLHDAFINSCVFHIRVTENKSFRTNYLQIYRQLIYLNFEKSCDNSDIVIAKMNYDV